MSHTPSSDRFETMPYNRCGRSGLFLPPISLGLWHNFGDVDDQVVVREMILGAFDRGITHFDLANNYGPSPGSAERNFGRILRGDLMAHRDEMVVSTKAGYRMWPGPYGEWGSRKNLLASLDQSLKRMELDYVDIFYSHRFDPDTPLEETMGALATAVKQGKALYAGISSYRPEEAHHAIAILRQMGVPMLIHQPRYNMLDRWIEDGLTRLLSDEGIGCIPFCPLAQGRLTDRYANGVPDDSRAAKSHGFLKREEVDEVGEKVRALSLIASGRGQTLAQMALAWVMRLPVVTSALIGASSLKQIDENLAALENLEFSEEELTAIDQALS